MQVSSHALILLTYDSLGCLVTLVYYSDPVKMLWHSQEVLIDTGATFSLLRKKKALIRIGNLCVSNS